MRIQRIQFNDVVALNWTPEPHTVTLNKDKVGGSWWGLFDDERAVSICCVFDRPHDKCFTRVFTPVEFRGKGYCTMLLYYLSNSIYNEHRLVAHCLKQSVKCFERAGFELVGVKHYKYSDLYSMKKEVNNGTTKN